MLYGEFMGEGEVHPKNRALHGELISEGKVSMELFMVSSKVRVKSSTE